MTKWGRSGSQRVLMGRLVGDGKVGIPGAECRCQVPDVHIAGAVHRDTTATIGIAAAEERGVNQAGAGRVQLAHKDVLATAERPPESSRGGREVGGRGTSRNVGV